ncbi:uncharacterized protein TRIADDRAFT_18273 [Trichoplax adhaerens]|uniref:Ion transport domain-containing protein n=1 Tax=Trichoplax adhaerens TaxID=10228 RepID=B3RI47_TRIAD|nr:hypothetical protein TRIADDRAFT_18273 [Trichoplax adhaerens]EDV28390.1 hypothetical protein TRIADDRAFT_18273 [Trichoplax adhaerens]|eukprot:XP_002107592.1 hypothetical protein TRIADDRAFT_18273 [Trichoplax adhaerens]
MYNLPLSDYGPDEVLANDETPSLLNDFNIKLLLKFCTVISAISVALNTPATFQSAEVIRYICLALDIFSGLVFLAEMIIKVRRDGFFKGDSAYFKKFWCIFDFIMLLCIWLTVIILSCITILNLLFRHSGQQIVTVSVFYLFFISLYSFVGVQLFGDLQQHCVDKTAVELRYLAIPDTLCSNFSDSGYQCPNDMVCIDLQYFDIQRTELGFVGFDNFLLGLLSVYQSSSLEGWVYTMYKTMDSYVSWYAYIYFLTMVFFVAWLIKNVFIAVITEAFAEMRSQLQEMWGNIALPANFSTKTLQETSGKWHLVTSEISYYRKNGEGITKVLHLRAFHATIIVCIIFDAAILASKFAHMPEDYANFIWYSQIAFTLLFNIEAIFKMYCYGIRSYLFRFAHIYELILAVGSSVYILIAIAIGQDSNLATKLTVFAVLRILRIVRILPMLQDFMFRILGNGKKIGLLLAFTICFLLIVSLLSLQLFSRVEKLKLFETYPAAVGSTFQVLLQEGWPDVMNDALLANTIDLSPLVAIYFTMLHLFASSILFSIFIAVILDSLDLDEEVKKYRQGKMHEESVVTEEKLPYRIRVYEKFREKPRMATIKKSTITSNFEIPKMRESFLKQYVNECTDDNSVNDTMPAEEEDNTAILHRRATARKVQLRRTITEDVTACNPADEQFQRSPNMLSPIPRCNTIDSQTSLYKPKDIPFKVTTYTYRASLISKGNVINKADLDTLKHIARRNKEKSDNLENEAPSDWVDVNAIIEKKQQAKIKRRAMEENLRENHPFFDTSLFLLSPNSHLRKLCQRIAHAKYNPHLTSKHNSWNLLSKKLLNILASFTYLNWFIIIVNISSCLIMAWETPHGPDVGLNFTQIADIIFIAVTSLELIIKIIADGLIFTPAALMRNFSGFLDIFVYFVSVLSYLYHAFNLSVNSGAEFLAVLRCLRPLRVITLVPKMSQVVSELVRGFKEILLVSLMLLMLLFTFANYGVQMFAGKLARCNKGFGIPQENCSGTFSIPLQVTTQVVGLRESKSTTLFVPEVWKVSPAGYSFDNIGKAMLTLFEVITLEGWTSMRSILQSMKQDFGIIYIHVFVFVGFMIGLTLFVGVVMTNFNENKGTALLTVDQRRWLDLKGRLKIAQPLHIPPRPDSTNRGQIYDIIESKYYRIFSIIIITSNCLMLYVKWSKDNEYLPDPSNFILAANLFIGWYWIEFFLRVIAYSFAGYFESYRNRYDFALILIGTAWLVLSVIFTAENEVIYVNLR